MNPSHLNKDIIELHYQSSAEIDEDRIVNGIILPSSAFTSAFTKTVIAQIKAINAKTSEDYQLFPGDTILVDRYAIIQTSKGADFRAFIRVDSVIMKEQAGG